MRTDSAVIILIPLILSMTVFGSFVAWWLDATTRPNPVSASFIVFVWSLVLAICWNDVVRAYQEWRNRKY